MTSFYPNCNQYVFLYGVQDINSLAYVTTGTGTFTITGGTPAVSITGTMSYVSGPRTWNGLTYPDGNYEGVLTAQQAALLLPGTIYTLTKTFTAPSGSPAYNDTRVESAQVQNRGAF